MYTGNNQKRSDILDKIGVTVAFHQHLDIIWGHTIVQDMGTTSVFGIGNPAMHIDNGWDSCFLIIQTFFSHRFSRGTLSLMLCTGDRGEVAGAELGRIRPVPPHGHGALVEAGGMNTRKYENWWGLTTAPSVRGVNGCGNGLHTTKCCTLFTREQKIFRQ